MAVCFFTVKKGKIMFAKVVGYTLIGLSGVAVDVEVDVNNGLPAFDVVGLADTAVKESKERIRSALKNSNRAFPTRKVIVNLAPADVKKEGSVLDLPLAIGVLISSGQLNVCEGDDKFALKGTVLMGELSLDGSLRRVNGVLPAIISAIEDGYTKFIIPKANEKEASYVEGAEVYAAENLTEVIDHISGLTKIKPLEKHLYKSRAAEKIYDTDIALVKGQKVAKRALEIAVAGGHNLLFVGAPGTGKTMLAKCIPTIMPDMTFEEALETTKIHSVAGQLNDEDGIVFKRPFRSPHHTATMVAMAGGGTKAKPGEISLAHNGVLFLDEMPEYTRQTLEVLRQPLEDGVISVSRAAISVKYPANFMLCGSMNPCPCGNYGSADKICTCSPAQIVKYKSKISGPLLDRIDIQVQVDEVKYAELTANEENETSKTVKERVNRTRLIQKERFKNDGILTNANMGEKQLNKYCRLSEECEKILKNAYEHLHLSPRARSRIIKVARTIADIALYDDIRPEHLLEAISYRQS